MSVVVIAAAGMSLVGGAMKGFSAMGNKSDVVAGQVALGDIYSQKLDLLGERKDLGMDIAESQFSSGLSDLSMGTQTGLRNVQQSGDSAIAKSGLATSGVIEDKVKVQTGDLMAKYKTDMEKLLDSRAFSKAEADLSYRSGKMSAEESYQSSLTGLESTPTTFLEGMFG